MPPSDDIEITFSPLYAWMLIGFGCFFFLLGLFILTPLAAERNVPAAVAICVAAAAGIAGGAYWLKHLPVMLRFTAQEMQFPGSASIRWSEMERVDVQTLDIDGQHVSYVCIKLKTKRPADGGLQRLFQAARNAIMGEYDIVLDEQKYARSAKWIAGECERRRGAM